MVEGVGGRVKYGAKGPLLAVVVSVEGVRVASEDTNWYPMAEVLPDVTLSQSTDSMGGAVSTKEERKGEEEEVELPPPPPPPMNTSLMLTEEAGQGATAATSTCKLWQL